MRMSRNEGRVGRFLENKGVINGDNLCQFPFVILGEHSPQELMVEKMTGFIGLDIADNWMA